MNSRHFRAGDSVGFGCFLHLLFPGLGYFLWKDYLFGTFVFLIAVIATGLAYLTLFVSLPLIAKTLLFGLPLLFYIVSFFDLARSIRRKRKLFIPARSLPLIFLLVGAMFQFLVPLAPASFLIRNRPELFRATGNDYSPLFRRGDLMSASRLAYTADLGLGNVGLYGAVLHALPKRCDVIRFYGQEGEKRLGLVVGLPGEEIEVTDGLLSVNGWPAEICSEIRLTGDWPLTVADDVSIMVAELQLGSIKDVKAVHPRDLIGKVSPVFDD